MGVRALAAAHGLNGSYPDDWEGFVGQDLAKRQLRVAVESAARRKAPLGHVLLASGTPGIGKTTLALLLVDALGARMKMVSGKVDTNAARITLAQLGDGDVLFIDEMHQLVSGNRTRAEWLLHLLQDGVIMGPRGPEVQPKVTVVGATTEAGRLPETVVGRFPLRPVLQPYTDDEAAIIAIDMATALFGPPLPFPTEQNFRDIARAGSNNPRTISSLVAGLRDLATVDLAGVYDDEAGYDLTEPLQWLGLHPDGLTEPAVRYLAVLMDEFQGQAGERALMNRLSEPGGLEHIERLLMDRDLIAKTKQGRVLTKAGIARARELTEQITHA